MSRAKAGFDSQTESFPVVEFIFVFFITPRTLVEVFSFWCHIGLCRLRAYVEFSKSMINLAPLALLVVLLT